MNGKLTETADRLREYDVFHFAGRELIVDSVSAAPTAAQPARLAIAGRDVRGPLTDETETVYLNAGETVPFRTERPLWT